MNANDKIYFEGIVINEGAYFYSYHNNIGEADKKKIWDSTVDKIDFDRNVKDYELLKEEPEEEDEYEYDNDDDWEW